MTRRGAAGRVVSPPRSWSSCTGTSWRAARARYFSVRYFSVRTVALPSSSPAPDSTQIASRSGSASSEYSRTRSVRPAAAEAWPRACSCTSAHNAPQTSAYAPHTSAYAPLSEAAASLSAASLPPPRRATPPRRCAARAPWPAPPRQRPPRLPQPEQRVLQQPAGSQLLLKQRHVAVVVRAHVALHALESGEALHEDARGEVARLFE
jgi:hypothetical protein